jgi:tetratricopeptide (TPR) repeat protein
MSNHTWNRLRHLVTLTGLALLTATGSGCVTQTQRLEYAQKKMDAGDYAGADAELDAVFGADTSRWEALYLRGQLRMKQARYEDAQFLLERSAAIRFRHKETPRIYDLLAESLFQQRKLDELRSMLADTASRYATTGDFIRQGRYLSRIGDPDGAEVALRKAVSVSDLKDIQPYMEMADFYESVGRRDKAVTALRYAYFLRPADPKITERLRAAGVVPGPTTGLQPQR